MAHGCSLLQGDQQLPEAVMVIPRGVIRGAGAAG
ncbi:hypothetical protein KT71_002613, partial [Congregibacter litoralis KT71]